MNIVLPNYGLIAPCIPTYYFSHIQLDMVFIKHVLLKQGFLIHDHIVNDCHDSFFSSICTFAHWFDMFAIEKIIAQTF